MHRPVFTPLRLTLALVLMASVAAWQPSMTLAHVPASHGTSGPHSSGHVPPGSPHHALPDACCDMCVAACSACPGLASARVWLSVAEPVSQGALVSVPGLRVGAPRPRLHPFPLGPPLLRVA